MLEKAVLCEVGAFVVAIVISRMFTLVGVFCFFVCLFDNVCVQTVM